MTWDRIGAMNAARARLPASGGKTYRRTVSRAPTPARDSWDWLYGSSRSQWDFFAGIAQEDYLRIAFPERYEAME